MKPIELAGWVLPLGLALALGLALREGEGDADVDGWPGPSLQATPLRAKSDGAGLPLLFHEPLNPKLVLPLVARLPFQPALRALTCGPLWVTVALQACVTCCPAPNDQVSVQ